MDDFGPQDTQENDAFMTFHCDNAREAFRKVKCADELGLGVRVWNRFSPEPPGEPDDDNAGDSQVWVETWLVAISPEPTGSSDEPMIVRVR